MGVAVPAAALALWEVFSRLGVISPRYFPAPTTVAWALVDRLYAGDLAGDLLVTLTRLAFAFTLAAVPAVPLGLLMGMARPVRNLVEPYLAFIFPVPKITLLPFLLIILGVGEPAFVLTGASSAFFQIVISTLGGVQTMDPRLVTIVAVEFIAAKSGLGHLVFRHWQMLSTPEMYAAFALVGGLGLVLTRGLRALQARVLTWQEDMGV